MGPSGGSSRSLWPRDTGTNIAVEFQGQALCIFQPFLLQLVGFRSARWREVRRCSPWRDDRPLCYGAVIAKRVTAQNGLGILRGKDSKENISGLRFQGVGCWA